MTRPVLAISAALVLASCATQKFGDAIIYGHTKDVSEADIRAALAARGTFSPKAHVYEIEVVNRDRIRLYLMPRGQGGDICVEVARIRGRWRDDGGWMREVL
jgi:hypothetical protein